MKMSFKKIKRKEAASPPLSEVDKNGYVNGNDNVNVNVNINVNVNQCDIYCFSE